VLFLMQQKGMRAEEVSEILYNQSGLLGVSGISDDMQVLLQSDTLEARQAVDLFVYRICGELGAMAAALGGLDALIFTAGIGEHAAEIRARVCRAAGWLGMALDEEANRRGGPCIARGKAGAWVVATDEDLMIARHVAALICR
jgi:acetate kinase